MDELAAVVAIVAPITTGGFTLTGVWLTQRSQERQRSRERQAAETAKYEDTTRELLEAVGSLQIALRESVPRWNSWSPKLTTLGLGFLEFAAGRKAAGLEYGLAQVGRIAVEHQQRELGDLDRLRVPLERVVAASTQVALLKEVEFREVGLRLSAAAATAVGAYGAPAVWHPKVAAARRARADDELLDAVRELLQAVDTRRQAVRPQPVRWWRRRRIAASRPR